MRDVAVPIADRYGELCTRYTSAAISKVNKSIYIRRLKARVTRRRSLVLDKQKRFRLSSELAETVR